MSEKRAASSPRTNQRKKPRKSVLKSEVNGPVRRSERRKSRVSFAPKNEVKEFDDYTSNSSANNSAAKDISVDKENTMEQESPSIFNMSTAPIGSKPRALDNTLDLLGGGEDFSLTGNRLSVTSQATQNFLPKTPTEKTAPSPAPAFQLSPSPKIPLSDRKKKKRPSLLQQVHQRRIFQREIDSYASSSSPDSPSTPKAATKQPESDKEVDSAAALRANLAALFASTGGSSPGSGSSADDEGESTEKMEKTMAFFHDSEEATMGADRTIALEKTMAMDETVNLGGQQRNFDKTVFMEQTVIGSPGSPMGDYEEGSTELFMQNEAKVAQMEEEEQKSLALEKSLAKPVVITPKTNKSLQNILDNPRTPEDVKKIASSNMSSAAPFEIPSPKIRSPLVDFDGISREIDLLNGNDNAPPTPDFGRSRGRQALMRARDSLGLAKHNQMKKFQRTVTEQITTNLSMNVSERTALESLTPVAPKRLDLIEPGTCDSLGSIPQLDFDSPTVANDVEMEESLLTPDTTEAIQSNEAISNEKTEQMQKMTMKIDLLAEGKTAEINARSLIGDNTMATTTNFGEISELPDVPDQSEELDRFVTDLKAAFDAPHPEIVMKALPSDRPHPRIMDNLLLQSKVELDKYLCDKFLRDMKKCKPAPVKFHYARDYDQFPVDLEKVMAAAEEKSRKSAYETIIKIQGDYLPLLDNVKLYKSEAEKVFKKDEELTPILAELEVEHEQLLREEEDLANKKRSQERAQSQTDEVQKEIEELERQLQEQQAKIDAIPEVKRIDWDARCEAVAKKYNFRYCAAPWEMNLFIDARLVFRGKTMKFERWPVNDIHHISIKHAALRSFRAPSLQPGKNFRKLDDNFIEFLAEKANSMRAQGERMTKRIYPFINSHNEIYLQALDKILNFMDGFDMIII